MCLVKGPDTAVYKLFKNEQLPINLLRSCRTLIPPEVVIVSIYVTNSEWKIRFPELVKSEKKENSSHHSHA